MYSVLFTKPVIDITATHAPSKHTQKQNKKCIKTKHSEQTYDIKR